MSTISRVQSATPIVSPLQLEVLDWTHYAKIFDVRSPAEYRRDHVPGAVNLSVSLKKARQLPRLAGIDTLIQRHSLPTKAGRLLVYGVASDQRVQMTVGYLSAAGFKVDTLYGGWQTYRRWVVASLAVLPYHLNFQRLRGSIASGKGPLLRALGATGSQAVDLNALADWPEDITTSPTLIQPTQMLYESRILEALRWMDPRRIVWIAAEKQRIGRLRIPFILYDRLLEASSLVVSAPLNARTRLLRRQEPALSESPLLVVDQIVRARQHISPHQIESWEALAASGDINALCKQLMTQLYDPLFERALRKPARQKEAVTRLHLAFLNNQYLRDVAKQLTLQQP